MYTTFFNLTKKPFSLTPDPSFLYLSEKHKKALTTLQYGLVSQAGFTVVTGKIGSGKTTLVRSVLSKLKEQREVGLITNTHSEFGDLLTWILGAFNIQSDAKNKADRYKVFVDFIMEKNRVGRRVVLIVDEAQNMDIQTLEELRLLSNININQDIMLQLALHAFVSVVGIYPSCRPASIVCSRRSNLRAAASRCSDRTHSRCCRAGRQLSGRHSRRAAWPGPSGSRR